MGNPLADTTSNALQTANIFLKSGAFWAALLLILLPMVLVSCHIDDLAADKQIGLPALAILGICALFGTCALIAVVFAQFQLSDRTQALALPEGSIRAAIALSLIVLFAIIAIMLYQSSVNGERYEIEGLSSAEKQKIVLENSTRVAAIRPWTCDIAGSSGKAGLGATKPQISVSEAKTAVDVPKLGASSPDAVVSTSDGRVSLDCYKVTIRVAESSAASDLAKQLLVLIGTLMTAVTSFYFASRNTPTPQPGPTIVKSSISAASITPASPVEAWPLKLSIKGKGLGNVTSLRLTDAQSKACDIAPTEVHDDFVLGELTDSAWQSAGLASGGLKLTAWDRDGALIATWAPALTVTK